MEKEQIVNKIKQFFTTEDNITNEVPAEVATEEVKTSELITKDGLVLTVHEDNSVMIGEEVAPDGEYVLEDDTILTVLEGKVVEVEEEEVEESPEVDETEMEIVPTEMELAIISLKEELELLRSQTVSMSDEISLLKSTPAAEEFKTKKTFSKENKDLSIIEQYAKIRTSK